MHEHAQREVATHAKNVAGDADEDVTESEAESAGEILNETVAHGGKSLNAASQATLLARAQASLPTIGTGK